MESKHDKKRAPGNGESLLNHLIHGRFESPMWEYAHHVVPPMSCSTTYRLDSAARGAQGFQEIPDPSVRQEGKRPIYVYDRMSEPTRNMLEERLAAAEGGETAVTFGSGMGAISAALGIHLIQGQHLVAHRTIYGCTHNLITNWLPRFGISHSFIDLTKAEQLQGAITGATRVVYFESPANPTMELIDIQAVCDEVKAINAKRAASDRVWVIVDNTFATPYCQRPIEHGADIVVHSLTKNISGFGTDMGGVVVLPYSRFKECMLWRKDFGAVIATKAAWSIMTYGLSTLPLRVATQQTNAMKVAQFLSDHPKVAKVAYPGLPNFPQRELAERQMRDFQGNFAPGIMLGFTLAGNPEEAVKRGQVFIDTVAQKAYGITLAVSLGQIRTLIEHPASMTHAGIAPEQMVETGIDPGGIRLSLGVEDPDDLIADLLIGFDAI